MSEAERNRAAAEDQLAAERERAARNVLLGAGADTLERRPWQPKPVPPSAIDLIQYFVWQSSQRANAEQAARRQPGSVDRAPAGPGARSRRDPGGAEADQALAALGLLRAARAEVDQLETGLLFAARGLGLTWAQTATALGLNSPQACQQRLDRLLAKGDQAADGVDQ